MARYRRIGMSPRLLPVDLQAQLVPGSFAHAVHHLVDKLDLFAFDAHYGRRFATVERVFGNVRANKRLNRFTLRGQAKVDGQWKLFALVHNIEKWANYRKAA
jgi:hypothetical protein